jgi:PilZ domain-containing protein
VFKERRKIPRRIINRMAQFHCDDGSLPRSCLITDISDGGARLYSETEMPQKFTLSVFDEGGDTRRECRVVWRLGGELGVEFTDRASR